MMDIDTSEQPEVEKKKRARRTTLFPASSFEEAMTIAKAIQKHAAGEKVRRLTLFDQIGKSPDSGSGRQLVVNSNRYGLTKGSYTAEHLELTNKGRIATNEDGVSWFSGNWSFPSFELTYSNGGKQHEKEAEKIHPRRKSRHFKTPLCRQSFGLGSLR
jgi:hypothetical protein